MRSQPVTDNTLVISYLTLRKIVGFLGMALPFILALGDIFVFKQGIQSSISSYYYTPMRNVFVGILWAIGVFLLSYRGYGLLDSIAGILACIFAIGVSLFPTTPDAGATPRQEQIGHIHIIFAALFFLTLACFSLFLFTKTDAAHPTPQKRKRNVVYRVCGWVMIVALVLIVVFGFMPSQSTSGIKNLDLVFVLESVAVLAFGISWITKGEAILKDAL